MPGRGKMPGNLGKVPGSGKQSGGTGYTSFVC